MCGFASSGQLGYWVQITARGSAAVGEGWIDKVDLEGFGIFFSSLAWMGEQVRLLDARENMQH